MKKLYMEYLYIPKDGKIREKVFLTRIALSVLIIVLLLAGMSLSAFAYFSADVTSGPITIKAANFDLDIKYKLNSETEYITIDNNEFNAVANKIYNITLTKKDNTTARGYCVIKYSVGGNETVKYTDIIIGPSQPYTFNFTNNSSSEVTVKFIPTWGSLPQDASIITDNNIIAVTNDDSNSQQQNLGASISQSINSPILGTVPALGNGINPISGIDTENESEPVTGTEDVAEPADESEADPVNQQTESDPVDDPVEFQPDTETETDDTSEPDSDTELDTSAESDDQNSDDAASETDTSVDENIEDDINSVSEQNDANENVDETDADSDVNTDSGIVTD